MGARAEVAVGVAPAEQVPEGSLARVAELAGKEVTGVQAALLAAEPAAMAVRLLA